MKLRRLLTLALAAAFLFVAPITAKADETAEARGWVKDSKGWWYEITDENGKLSYYKDGIYGIDDPATEDVYEQYYFNKEGYMVTGWFKYTIKDEYTNSEGVVIKNNNTVWMYADSKGALQCDTWKKIDGSWYYFDGCAMVEDCTYPIWEDGAEEPTYYHFAPTGEMTTGWYWHDYDGYGYWYYSESNGKVVDGWKKFGTTWYYFYNGRMAESEWVSEPVKDADGNVTDWDYYYLDSQGKMVTGWYNRAGVNSKFGNWIYCGKDGKAYDGWLSYAGAWYYIQEGVMKTNTYVCTDKLEDGTMNGYTDSYASGNYSNYFLGRDGVMVTGWYDLSTFSAVSTQTKWLYASADGSIKEQWVKSGNDWYFVNSNGIMAANGLAYCELEAEKEPVRESYDSWEAYYDAQDAWERAHYYVFDATGKMVTNAWYKTEHTTGTTWLYADGNGNAYTGWVQTDGKWYYCSYGSMVTNSYVPGGYYVGADGVWVQ